jgi:hypothetical protein
MDMRGKMKLSALIERGDKEKCGIKNRNDNPASAENIDFDEINQATNERYKLHKNRIAITRRVYQNKNSKFESDQSMKGCCAINLAHTLSGQ